jgi:uncharacterized damage-inducible protein DinB
MHDVRDHAHDLRPVFMWAMARMLSGEVSRGAGCVRSIEEDTAMKTRTQVDTLRSLWNREAERTLALFERLPREQYDFRPDPRGRSIGELAWHLSEIDACLSFGIEERRFRLEDEPPNLARPRQIELLAPGYRRVHEEALARLESLDDADLDESVTYFDGRTLKIRDVIEDALIRHLIHHRGQLTMLCRMAGGRPPGIFGPNREEMEEIRTRMSAAKG